MSVTFCNKESLKIINLAIGEILDGKDPFGYNNVLIGMSWNKIPNMNLMQSFQFFVHGGNPLRMLDSRFEPFRLTHGE